jgi:CRISPR/Cas system endoribonuclease Cas6 (RAMP superfamily)
MDVIGNMFLLKEGGDCLPKNAEPIFNDLFEIQSLEKHLNGSSESVIPVRRRHSIRFTDEHFRQYTDLRMNSNEIKALLLETSRIEFKLTFPVRLKSTGAKENTHRMNYYSRFFELGHEDLSVKRNGVVLSRRYTVVFSTLLGELFANNLLAKFNDRIDNRFYQLPNSAQIFYRKALIHNDIKRIPFNLATIANYAGLADSNPWNLSTTVEINILKPLIEYGYIDSYEKEGENPKAPKYIIHRFGSKKIG